jgi:hypothetical protein
LAAELRAGKRPRHETDLARVATSCNCTKSAGTRASSPKTLHGRRARGTGRLTARGASHIRRRRLSEE